MFYENDPFLHLQDPKIMGIGPAPAIRQLMNKTGRQLSQVDLIEVSSAALSKLRLGQKGASYVRSS